MKLLLTRSIWALLSAVLAAGPSINAEARPARAAAPPPHDAPDASFPRHVVPPPEPEGETPVEPQGATPCVGGMAGIYPCNNVDLMAFMPLNTIGGGNGSSLWGWTDPDTQREYALMGRSNGTAFVDVTDPVNPVFLGSLRTHTGNSTWREIKTHGYYAYIVSDINGNHGMQIFDLRRLRNPPTGPVLRESGWYGYVPGTHPERFERCHNIVINTQTGYAYCVGTDTCAGGLHMMSLADPLNPQFVGCFSADGYTHDAQCVVYNGPDTAHVGKEICFNSNEDTVTIVDVTNKAAPVMLSRTGYAGSSYTHQGWLTADHRYFLVDDELDETDFGHPTWTYIWNLSDLDAPVLIGHYTHPTNAIDHNLFIHQGYAYQSNYTAGLRILDIAGIATGNLTQAAFFDLYPAHNNPIFSGTWNNYPFFASGTVIASSMSPSAFGGLYVLRPNLATGFTLATADPMLAACVPGSDATTLDLGSQNGYAGSVKLSAAGLPAGVSAAFDPSPAAAVPGTSTLTLTAATAVPGSHPFTVTATDGTRVDEQALTLHLADAAPEEPVLTSPPTGAFNQVVLPVFTWDAAAGGASYDIQVATDPGFTAIVSQAAGLAATTFTPTAPLVASVTHYWRVRAVNGCAAGAWSDVSSFTTTSAPGGCPLGTAAAALATEGFESGAPGWTSTGAGSTWGASTSQVNSGTFSFGANAPAFVTDQILTSPPVTLPTGQAPLSMQFWNYQDIEDLNIEHHLGCADGAIAEISTDGGGSWTQLPSTILLTDPYDGAVDGGAEDPLVNPLSGLNAWCGQPQPWLNSVVDINAYAGQTVRFRFRLGTNESVGTEGWYVDDYLVQSCVAQTPELSVADTEVAEGHPEGPEGLDHPVTAVFTVTLSGPAQQAVTMSYQTSDGTATAGVDYLAASGVLTIPAGSVTGTVSVTILDDDLDESDETLLLDLSNVVGAIVVDAQAEATILDDDPH